MRYVDTYFQNRDGVSASAAMIYPKIPLKADLREAIEDYFHENAIVVIWFNEGDAVIS